MQLRKIAPLLLLAACGASHDLDRLRDATRPFQQLDAAVAAGYPRDVADCLIHEHHGAMGYHHVNRALVDAKVEIEKPEILLYERTKAGEYRLNGVEYIVPYRAWPKDSIAPTVLGEKLMRVDNLNIWGLHVWLWNKNPNGLFAEFHPNVECPADNRKVFTPVR
jgi:hypothetical protein